MSASKICRINMSSPEPDVYHIVIDDTKPRPHLDTYCGGVVSSMHWDWYSFACHIRGFLSSNKEHPRTPCKACLDAVPLAVILREVEL